MSLATRCTECGTIFRVVQDQLKISQGWVRCGRCDAVFHAIEGLFDLERDAPPHWVPPSTLVPSEPAAVVTANFHTASSVPEHEEEVFQLDDADRIHSRFFHPEQDDVEKTPAQALSQRDRVDFADARFNDSMLKSESRATTKPARTSKPKPSKKKKSSIAERRLPEFLQAGPRHDIWQHTSIRNTLILLVAGLVLSLLLQITFYYRHDAALRWPSTKPWLVKMCNLLACQIELPRHINQITIESSALSPASGTNTYRLNLTLQNRHTLPLMVPAVDLILSDLQGEK
jgi:predicted Zn finger-like uncharacterized protein